MSLSYLPDFTFTASFLAGDQVLPTDANRDQFTIRRGSGSLSLTGLVADAGSAVFAVDNFDRRFDPTFTTGPYYPDIVPGVPLSIIATWAATDYPIFFGPIIQWPQLYGETSFDQSVDIQAADAIRALARAQFTGTRPAESTGDRISAVLAAIGYSGTINIDPGTARVPPIDTGQSSTSAMSLLNDATQAEWGVFFHAVQGGTGLVFLDRNSIGGIAGSPIATFGDAGGGELPFLAVIVDYDDIRLVNDALLNYSSKGAQASAEDATSQGEPTNAPRGKLSWQQSIPMEAGTLARSYTHHVVQVYKEPTPRFSQLIVDPALDPTNLWPVVLGTEVGQSFTVKLTPQGGGARIVQDIFIRSIDHTYQNKKWRTVYGLDDSSLITVGAHYGDGTKYGDGTVYAF